MITRSNIQATWQYIKADHATWPLRFWLEVSAWAMTIVCSVIMMLTVPTPPFLLMYPLWITGCAVYGWAAWTRGSFGMLSNYLLLVTIDMAALIRLLV